MRSLWTGMRKDWQRVRRDPLALGTSLGIPLVLAVLLSLVFGRGQPRPEGRLLVADQGGTMVRNMLLSGFQREPLSQMFTIEKVPVAAGRERINHGDASALLIIPK